MPTNVDTVGADGKLNFADSVMRPWPQEPLLKTGALQDAIFNSVNFSSIATDAQGVIQLFSIGAERMLGYQAAEVIGKITLADIFDLQKFIRGRFSETSSAWVERHGGRVWAQAAPGEGATFRFTLEAVQ